MANVSISEVMQAYAQDAVDFARERFKIDLNFSEDSLEQTEKILANLHNSLPKGLFAKMLRRGPSNDQIWQMSKMWGGYLGEVIRQRWSGEWKTEAAAQPRTIITLRVLGANIFPPAKVYKRLTNGVEDNIWHYYQVLKQDFERTQSGRQ